MNNCIDLTFGNYFPTWINDRVCQTYVWSESLLAWTYVDEPRFMRKFKTIESLQLAVI